MQQQDRRQPETDFLADPKHGPYYRTSALSKRGVQMTTAPIRIRTFKDLLVWQKAMDLSVEVYRLTRHYPSHERYDLTAETRKTSRSVPYNIAEGHKRGSTAEYICFLASLLALPASWKRNSYLRVAWVIIRKTLPTRRWRCMPKWKGCWTRSFETSNPKSAPSPDLAFPLPLKFASEAS